MDLVVVSLEQWDEVWRRNQHLVAGLMRRDGSLRVLFVEPAADPIHGLVTARNIRRGTGLRSVALDGVSHGRLWTFQPTKWLPRRIHRRSDDSLARATTEAAKRIGMTNPLLWVNDPCGAVVLTRTNWPSLYDITDDWLAAERPTAELVRLAQWENTLLERSRKVVVCSTELASRKGTHRDVVVIPNAVDVAAYQTKWPRPRDLPHSRVVLYVGTVHRDRIDLELTSRMAREAGDNARVILLGPVALTSKEGQALASAGVDLLGPRPAQHVPAYLQHAEVLIVPHRLSPFTASLDPIKAYEYAAAGRPVVATPVPGFGHDPSMGNWVVDPSRFVSQVRAILSCPAALRDIERPVQDWSERVSQMGQVLQQMAGSRDG